MTTSTFEFNWNRLSMLYQCLLIFPLLFDFVRLQFDGLATKSYNVFGCKLYEFKCIDNIAITVLEEVIHIVLQW